MNVARSEATPGPRRWPVRPHASRGFTLLELLISISVIFMLLALAMPGYFGVRTRSHKFKCQMNLRSVAFDLSVFADPTLHGGRGDDDMDSSLRRDEFWLETFQESQYRMDEFWDRSNDRYEGTTGDLGVMACPDVKGRVVINSNTPCRGGAMQPSESVSYAFNLRLDYPDKMVGGHRVPRHTPLSERMLSEPGLIPLLWDADGTVAKQNDVTPHYSAPGLDENSPYSDNRVWFPGFRHGGRMQVAFVSGEVLCTTKPLAHETWRWDYTP
ncbi:MAG: type II secretion system protein [Planctomycetes bacterium]|nr:type II secretion system protein [Planctomycetota bacterium]